MVMEQCEIKERMGWMRKDGAKIWFEVTHGKLFGKGQRKIKVRFGWMRKDCVGEIQR